MEDSKWHTVVIIAFLAVMGWLAYLSNGEINIINSKQDTITVMRHYDTVLFTKNDTTRVIGPDVKFLIIRDIEKTNDTIYEYIYIHNHKP